MRRAVLAVLLLCLLPGLAQEAVTGSDLPSPSRTAATVPTFVTAADLGNSSSSVSEFASVAPGNGENGTIALADTPAVTEAESSTGAPGITRASQEPATDRTGTATSPAAINPETREATGPDLTQPPPTRPVTEDGTTGPLSSVTESPLHPRTLQTPLSTEPPEDTTASTTTTTTTPSSWTSAITTSLLTTTTVTTVLPTTPARPHTTRAQVQRDPPQLEESSNKGLPSFHTGNSSNPLFVMIVSVFTIVVVMVVVVVGFRRYKKRNRRTEFRRLQDLPMDDMMEDTPLSLYSY